jgi:hypothetical protein
MEAICSFETLVDFQRTTWYYIPEDSTLHNHRYENLKSYVAYYHISFEDETMFNGKSVTNILVDYEMIHTNTQSNT